MTLSTDFDSARTYARLAHEMASSRPDQDNAQRVAELAVLNLGCDGATVCDQVTAGRLRLLGSTDTAVSGQLVRLTADDGGLPGAVLREGVTLSSDLTTENRWPGWAPAVAGLTRCVTGLPLTVDGRGLGVLLLHASTPAGPDLIATAEVFAAHAALALETVRALARAEHLDRALQSNRRIGTAIGVLMAGRKITEEQAFELLRSTSQRRGTKLHQVADIVVETGALPLVGDTAAAVAD